MWNVIPLVGFDEIVPNRVPTPTKSRIFSLFNSWTFGCCAYACKNAPIPHQSYLVVGNPAFASAMMIVVVVRSNGYGILSSHTLVCRRRSVRRSSCKASAIVASLNKDANESFDHLHFKKRVMFCPFHYLDAFIVPTQQFFELAPFDSCQKLVSILTTNAV